MRYLLVILFALFSIVLSGQWTDDTWRYEDTTRFISEKHPKYGPWNKPTSLNDPGLVAAYNMIPSAGGVLTDISGNDLPFNVNQGVSTVNGILYDGGFANRSTITILSQSAICLRLKPSSFTAFYPMSIGGSSSYLRMTTTAILYRASSSNILTFLNTNITDQWYNIVLIRNGTSARCYFNGVESSSGEQTLSADNNFLFANLGGFSTNLPKCEYEDLNIYNTTFTEQQAQDYHNSFAKRVVLIDNFEYDAVGSIPLGWQIESGTFAIAEDATSKYISCTGNGNIVFHGVDLSQYFESGWVKTLTGDLSGDQDDTVDNATNLAYSNGKLTVTMTSGQKLRELIITQSEEQ